MKLTLFYDATCPLCVAEMRELKRHDNQNHITLVDIFQDNFTNEYPEINPSKARDILHALYKTEPNKPATLLLGLDVTAKAWEMVEQKKWIQWLRLPVIKWFADKAYLVFARNRYRFSFLFTGKAKCKQCQLP